MCVTAGRSERSARRHPLHHECAACVSDLLAHLQHHGRQPVRREVLPLRQQHHGRDVTHQRGEQHVRVHGTGQREHALEKRQDQL